MITQKQAEQLVYDHINLPWPSWPDKPEMVVTRIVERPLGWVISWTTRPAKENPGSSHALAGNAPYLVSRADGAMFAMPYRGHSYEERLRDAENELQAHLQSQSQI
jgi:hypothetical protein